MVVRYGPSACQSPHHMQVMNNVYGKTSVTKTTKPTQDKNDVAWTSALAHLQNHHPHINKYIYIYNRMLNITIMMYTILMRIIVVISHLTENMFNTVTVPRFISTPFHWQNLPGFSLWFLPWPNFSAGFDHNYLGYVPFGNYFKSWCSLYTSQTNHDEIWLVKIHRLPISGSGHLDRNGRTTRRLLIQLV